MRFRYFALLMLPFSLNADPGAEVFESTCEVCHGEQAEGNEDMGAPKLAGQHRWYLQRQLENFRAGYRGTHEDDEFGPVMQPMAAMLSDVDIESVLNYIETLDATYVADD